MLGHRPTICQTMNRSDRRYNNITQDAALNGARVLVSRAECAWDAERTGAERSSQHAGAWMRAAQAVP